MESGGIKHERYYFRVLRPDENVQNIIAKNQSMKPPTNKDDKRESIQEHIRHGSRAGYKSPWLSLTADLDVALAFAGPVSRVAIISRSELEKEKSEFEIVHLDKDYLRSILTDEDAIARSRRSDEVLVFRGLKCAKLLQIKLNKPAHRTLAVDRDASFPLLDNTLPKAIKMIGGSNKRLFIVELDGHKWIANLPRPNYDLDSSVLFDSKLVNLCKHQFATFCAYRALNASVPKCALYVCELSVDNNLRPCGSYTSAFILMEYMDPCVSPHTAVETAQSLFPIDLLLGNWDPIAGSKDSSDLVDEATAAFFQTREKSVVRVTTDRALGCIYPEDRKKSDKLIIEFEDESTGSLRKCLQNTYKWCYGSIEKRRFVQMIMDLKIEQAETLKLLQYALEMSPGLPWDEKKADLWATVQDRIENLLTVLPFYEICPVSDEIPLARDGHGAVALHQADTVLMYICGGNSENGPLSDLWKFNVTLKDWTRLADMPTSGRYSFSMHLLQHRYIVIYGGCTNVKGSMKTVGDILLYDIENNKWQVIVTFSDKDKSAPVARCRHASHFVNLTDTESEMFILGGHDGKGTRNDVWKGKLVRASDKFVCTWTRLPNLKEKTHRCFVFAHGDKYYLLGGFGRNLRKIQEVILDTSGSRSAQTVVTHSYLELPESEEECFMDSKSLAGFGAAYDEIGERVILIGGGNFGKRIPKEKGTSPNKTFGNVPGNREVKSKPRIVCLNRMGSCSNSDWAWKTIHLYESLDTEHKLPDLLHWSAVYMDHSVILFGGRNKDAWSNKVFKVQLRPAFKDDSENVREEAISLCKKLQQLCLKYSDPRKTEILHNILKAEISEVVEASGI